jgi:tetratricopeptide (TPR) repeat protein
VRIPAARVLAAAAALLAAAGAARSAPVPPGDGKEEAPKATPYKEQFKDEVHVKGARTALTGIEVVYEGWDKVDWKAKSGPVNSKPSAEILSLKLADEPIPFTRGMEKFRAGQWDEADQEFRGVKSAVDAGKSRKLWEARAAVYVGECRRRAAAKDANPAKFKEAASTFEEALKQNPKSASADVIYLGLAECQAGLKEWDAGLKALDDLRKLATEAGRPLWEGWARLLRGRFLERKGELGGAATEYADLSRFAESATAKAPPDSPDRKELEALRVNGLVSQGWALYARAERSKAPGDLEAARKHFEGLPTATGGSVAGRAAAANGLGGILLLEGKPQKALESFIEVEVTMFQVPDEVARALWYKAQAYDRLGNGGGREQAMKDLAEYYPWSEWAARAR